jgi:hypothetical protein
MTISTVRQLCTPSPIVQSDSLIEQVAQIEDFGSGEIDGRAFFQRNYFTSGLELLNGQFSQEESAPLTRRE